MRAVSVRRVNPEREKREKLQSVAPEAVGRCPRWILRDKVTLTSWSVGWMNRLRPWVDTLFWWWLTPNEKVTLRYEKQALAG